MILGDAIARFTAKIGTYDKANWEVIIEERELQFHAQNFRKEEKVGLIQQDFIDLDLVRGSSFHKTKPVYNWFQVTWKGVLRTIFFPLYYTWWVQQLGCKICIVFTACYMLELACLIFSIYDNGEIFEVLPMSEVVSPMVVMFILGEVYIHVVSNNFTKPKEDNQQNIKSKRPACFLGDLMTEDGVTSELTSLYSTGPRLRRSSVMDPVNKSNEFKVDKRVPRRRIVRQPQSSETQPGADTELDVRTSTCKDGIKDHSGTGDEIGSTDNDSRSSTSSMSESEDNQEVRQQELFSNRIAPSSNNQHSKSIQNPDVKLVNTDDTVLVCLWEGSNLVRVRLSFMDISSFIVEKVQKTEKLTRKDDYVNMGFFMACVFAFLPLLYQLYLRPFRDTTENGICLPKDQVYSSGLVNFTESSWISATTSAWIAALSVLANRAFNKNPCYLAVQVTQTVARFILSFSYLFLLCVAERIIRARYLYSKYFGALTSTRRAKRNGLPHFRLHKVRNIKAWMSLRSLLKRRGPQRSVDVIVSSSFMLTLALVVINCTQMIDIQSSEQSSNAFLMSHLNWELLFWCLVMCVFQLRFMTLGSEINRKYRNSYSVLITEQINLYLQMEKNADKKEELVITNNVLKLASKLLKELETPFKISGIIMNPLLYNLMRVVVLSLFSGVLSDLLGFRIKLWKIKTT